MPDARAAALPDWPRALRAPLAAAYVGLSEATFRREVAVRPVALTPHVKAWLREDLDRWLDERAGRMAASGGQNPWHS